MKSTFSFSSSQINDITSSIPETNAAVTEISTLNQLKFKEIVRRQLLELSHKKSLKREITQNDIEYIKKYIEEKCERSFINPGENVGLLAAESVSEPITQSNLNSKTATGSNELSNIKIVTEILNITKNRKQPTATIHFLQDGYIKEPFTEIDMINISKAFVKIPLKNLFYSSSYSSAVEFVEIFPEGKNHKEDPIKKLFYSNFEKYLKATNEKKHDDFVNYVINNVNRNTEFLRLKFNTVELFRTRISTKDIAEELENIDSLLCVFSPTRIGIIDIYLKDLTVKQIEKIKDIVESSSSKDKTEKKEEKVDEKYFKKNVFTQENKDSLFFHTHFLPEIYSNNIYIKSSLINKEINNILTEQLSNPLTYFNSAITEFKDVEIKKYIIEHFFKYELYDEKNKRIELYIDVNKLFFETGLDINIIKKYLTTRFSTEFRFEFNSFFDPIKRDVIYVYNDSVTGYFTILDRIRKADISNPGSGTSGTDFSTERFYIKAYLFMNSAQITSSSNTDKENSTVITTVKDSSGVTNSNTLGVLSILRNMHAIIDNRYTVTNNFYEIYNIFGIESCRYIIMKEIKERLINDVSMVHIKILTDVMTNYGILTGFTHNATSLKNLGAYYNSSFEQALQSFKKAALSGKEEMIDPVSTCVLFGKRCNFGTGMFKLLNKNVYSTNESNQTEKFGDVDGEDDEEENDEVDKDEVSYKKSSKKFFNKALMD